jgi:flagellar protein FlbB
MIGYGSVGTGPRIFLLLLLILVLAFGGLIWFDYLGIVDVKDLLSPVFSLVGLRGRTQVEQLEDPLLLDRERLDKQWEALELRAEELDNREAAVEEQEAELLAMVEELEEREAALEQRENSFNERLAQYENRSRNIRTVAQDLSNMPPEQAVARLEAMDDQLVIDILRSARQLAEEQGQASLVPFWLSMMPPERAATLSRKAVLKPDQG